MKFSFMQNPLTQIQFYAWIYNSFINSHLLEWLKVRQIKSGIRVNFDQCERSLCKFTVQPPRQRCSNKQALLIQIWYICDHSILECMLHYLDSTWRTPEDHFLLNLLNLTFLTFTLFQGIYNTGRFKKGVLNLDK